MVATESRQTKKRQQTVSKYKLASFFAGIGGFDLGFSRAGFTTNFLCEVDPFCQNVLARHWPDIQVDPDIKQLNAKDIPLADVWVGGFPCQDVSLARGGRGRDGLRGQNSGLFYPFIELVKESKPRVLLLENVPGLLNSHGGKDFAIILSELCNAGYGVAWRILNTRYFGAPQSRSRVYIAASKLGVNHAADCLYEKEPAELPERVRLGFLRASKCAITSASLPEVAYCLAATSGRHTGTDWSRSYVSYSDSVRRLTPRECEGLQGFPVGWSKPGKALGIAYDEIDSLRYHALGNAVSVPVVEWIANKIHSCLKRPSRRMNGSLQNAAKEFAQCSLLDTQLSDIISDDRGFGWKSGGVALGGSIIQQRVSPAPVDPIGSEFVDVIEKRQVEEKYFLSPNAATGILRRVNSQGRTLFEPLHCALLSLSKKQEQKKTSFPLTAKSA